MRKRSAFQTRAQSRDTFTADGYWTGAHTKHRLRYHLVWVPKYRRRVLTEPIAARLVALLQQACDVNRWGLHEINVQLDHVHLLLQVPPDDSISGVVGSLKGGTSRVLRAEFPDLEEYLWGNSFWSDGYFWGNSFWSDGYFAESVGQAEEAVVRTYIQNQGLPKSFSRRSPKPSRTKP
jgi:putative transposase